MHKSGATKKNARTETSVASTGILTEPWSDMSAMSDTPAPVITANAEKPAMEKKTARGWCPAASIRATDSLNPESKSEDNRVPAISVMLKSHGSTTASVKSAFLRSEPSNLHQRRLAPVSLALASFTLRKLVNSARALSKFAPLRSQPSKHAPGSLLPEKNALRSVHPAKFTPSRRKPDRSTRLRSRVSAFCALRSFHWRTPASPAIKNARATSRGEALVAC